MLDEFIHKPRIAYFSMEIALRNEIPTYAGGLGILAGDTLRSATDLGLPMVAVSLISRAGYFRQELDAEGKQIEQPATWDPLRWALPLDAKIAVHIDGRTGLDTRMAIHTRRSHGRSPAGVAARYRSG